MMNRCGISRTRNISIIIILSVLGGIFSVPVGYAGRLLSAAPFLSFILSQFLSGLHIFWLIMAVLLTRRESSALVSGALKGIIEVSLSSHLGFFAFLISFVEGIVAFIALLAFKKVKYASVYLASGFSSASNVIVLQLILIPALPTFVYVFMYLVSFISGLLFGGFFCSQIRCILPNEFSAK